MESDQVPVENVRWTTQTCIFKQFPGSGISITAAIFLAICVADSENTVNMETLQRHEVAA